MPEQPLLSWPLDQALLVEASAGTGKTYTITALYARLVVELGLPVERILAVTYTEAATRELRGRIRARLVALREAFDNGGSEDPFCQQVVAACDDPATARRRLERAVSGLDQAAVYTIHGFCQRVLAETALESGVGFDSEVLTDTAPLLQEICDDFWRQVVLAQPRPVIESLLADGQTADSLPGWLPPGVLSGNLHVLDAEPRFADSLDQAVSRRDQAYHEARACWMAGREAVSDILLQGEALNRARYRASSVGGWLQAMEAAMSPAEPHARRFNRFDRFTPEALAKATRKGCAVPAHDFFDACARLLSADQELLRAVTDQRSALRASLRDYLAGEFAARKAARHQHGFDDLVTRLRDALVTPHGSGLAESLRRRYPAALIDEFQDTDPVQLAIFNAIYDTPRGPRVLVGDPKQAIYSFRGADLFAYLAGRRGVAETRSLAINYRSDPALVAAVHSLFARHPNPFVFDDVEVGEVRGEAGRAGLLREDGDVAPCLQLRFLARQGIASGDRPVNRDTARRIVCRDVAADIVRLLRGAGEGRVTLDGRALHGGDIAVLVRTHQQARAMRDVLAACGVPAVRHGLDSVFASDEAGEVGHLLRAVAEPGRSRWLRAALATSLLGHDAAGLAALDADEAATDTIVDRFRGYHARWRERGFMAMFRALLVDHQVHARLLGRDGGERAMTNVIHLAELIQQRCHLDDAPMEVVLRWYAAMREGGETDADEAQLRLESDARRVRIITMHTSKGLEFPVVYCPFAWDGALRAPDSELALFHDPEHGHRASVDFGSADFADHRALATREEFAESVRLLYVALTRAGQRCIVYHGEISGAETAALSWLLHHREASFDAAALSERVRGLSTAEALADCAAYAAKNAGAVRVDPVDAEAVPARLAQDAPGTDALAARPFGRELRQAWRIGSFTSLHAGAEADAPDHDGRARDIPAGEEAADASTSPAMHRYPRGARTGIAWHRIFERLDFAEPGVEPPAGGVAPLDTLVADELARAGIEPAWHAATLDMVRHVLAADLAIGDGVALQDVGRHQRIDEMGFFYPVAALDVDGLRDLLARHGGERAEDYVASVRGLAFDTLRGYLRGFIDLVLEHGGRYYLVDYKSNHLGRDAASYDQDGLADAMDREGYRLQYLVYVVALHRYLGLRIADYDYDRHFGGVRYLFLRGMHAGEDRGVFRDRPPRALVEALDAWLGGEDGA